MNYCELVSADARLVILRMLAQDPGYSHNEYVLSAALASYGHKLSKDRIRTELAWLDEQQLIHLEDVSGVKVARLSSRGADVAAGTATCPGVKRPGPED